MTANGRTLTREFDNMTANGRALTRVWQRFRGARTLPRDTAMPGDWLLYLRRDGGMYFERVNATLRDGAVQTIDTFDMMRTVARNRVLELWQANNPLDGLL